MKRELVILILEDGSIKVHGDDLPDMAGLEALVGPQPVEQELAEFVSTELNHHLCG